MIFHLSKKKQKQKRYNSFTNIEAQNTTQSTHQTMWIITVKKKKKGYLHFNSKECKIRLVKPKAAPLWGKLRRENKSYPLPDAHKSLLSEWRERKVILFFASGTATNQAPFQRQKQEQKSESVFAQALSWVITRISKTGKRKQRSDSVFASSTVTMQTTAVTTLSKRLVMTYLTTMISANFEGKNLKVVAQSTCPYGGSDQGTMWPENCTRHESSWDYFRANSCHLSQKQMRHPH